MNHKQLWKKIFDDTDKYVDFYFKEKAKKSIVYSKYTDKELVSMAFFTPYKMVYKGTECICPYIVGVATHPDYRHQGCMRMILEQGLLDWKLRGASMAFLSPADEAIYEPFGFQGSYYRRVMEVRGHKEKWYVASSFSRLEADVKKRVAEFANAQLYAEDLDFYVKRDVAYYDLLYKETKALGGKVIILREGTLIRGVAAYTHEEDAYEITEVICAPEDGQKVMETVCAYISEEESKTVIFSDSYFLRQVSGDGIAFKQEKKPYIMLKSLNTDEDVTQLNVYINDIT